MHSESFWTELTTDPMVIYDKKFDQHIVYWCGVAMLHETACALAMHKLTNCYTTASMKESLYKKFITLYNTGLFKTSAWDDKANLSPSGHYDFLAYIIEGKNGFKDKDIRKVLALLNTNRSLVHDSE